MKKFFITAFIATLSIITFSCKSEDDGDGGGSNIENLTVTIDGEQVTFNSIIVENNTYTEDGETYGEYVVTATINNATDRIITFYVFHGDLGADAIDGFDYEFGGLDYYMYSCDSFNFSSIVTVNNGSRIEANFSGTLCGWDNATQQEVSVQLTNGNILVDF
jgi:hypothetical protein